ncbi:MAG: hypothetical protein ABIL09_29840 [Gemmatimonadota bacterium]
MSDRLEEYPAEVSPDLSDALDHLTGIYHTRDRSKATELAESVRDDRTYQFCTFIGRCYYCWDGSRWVIIGCYSP